MGSSGKLLKLIPPFGKISNLVDCPQCGISDVIEIKHRLPDGSEILFFSCHKCEEKWWDQAGQLIDLRQVLELVRKTHG